MFSFLRDNALYGMAGLRILSGSIEVTAALLMLYFGSLERAMEINAGLSLVGPTVLILVTAIGLVGLAGTIPIWRVGVILLGVTLILFGARG